MTCMASSSNNFCLLCCILIDWCVASISHNIQSNLLYTRFSEVVNCYKDIAINMKSFMIKYNENINFYIPCSYHDNTQSYPFPNHFFFSYVWFLSFFSFLTLFIWHCWKLTAKLPKCPQFRLISLEILAIANIPWQRGHTAHSNN